MVDRRLQCRNVHVILLEGRVVCCNHKTQSRRQTYRTSYRIQKS